ncbi:site-2 protease family protein [Desulfotruncus alcoholivorax]|uniref:site-2 protease family protein n=1 Tax=Desulfotruncus alcoholivorax TaxID=265477 RepID=UPI0009D66CFE
MSIFNNPINFLVILAIAIPVVAYIFLFTHETGHYLAGILLGYKANEVVIGTCRHIADCEINGTIFRFNLFPGGGRCGKANTIMPEFGSVWKALIFYSAGTLINIIISCIVFWILVCCNLSWAYIACYYMLTYSIGGIIPKAQYCDGKAVLLIAISCISKKCNFNFVKERYDRELPPIFLNLFKLTGLLFYIIMFTLIPAYFWLTN